MHFKSQKTLHKLSVSAREKVYFSSVYQNGKLYLDVRIWKREGHSGKYKPSRFGFKIDNRKIEALDYVSTKFKVEAVTQSVL